MSAIETCKAAVNQWQEENYGDPLPPAIVECYETLLQARKCDFLYDYSGWLLSEQCLKPLDQARRFECLQKGLICYTVCYFRGRGDEGLQILAPAVMRIPITDRSRARLLCWLKPNSKALLPRTVQNTIDRRARKFVARLAKQGW